MCRVLEKRKFSPGMIVIGRRDLDTSMMLLARGQVGGKVSRLLIEVVLSTVLGIRGEWAINRGSTVDLR
jgi:hypothetical protein